MPVTYYIDKDRNIVVGRASGLLSPTMLIDGFTDIVRATGGNAMKLDHLFVAAPGTQLHELNSAGMTSMRKALEALHLDHAGRVMRAAIVVSGSDPQNALARLWQATADAYPAMATQVKLFQNEDEAIAWLTDKSS